MFIKNLNSSTLATVLVVSLKEEIIEPFRLQPNLTLVVDFEEYIKFCRTELGYGYNWLATETSTLHELIREYDLRRTDSAYKKLFSAFLLDMAFSVFKELSFADVAGQDTTVIRHSVNNAREWDEAKINEYYVNLRGSIIEQQLWADLSNRDIRVTNVSPSNTKHYKYALVAYGTARLGLVWSSK